jgi:hypothetical protein
MCGLAAALLMNIIDLAEYANKTAFLCMSLSLVLAAVRSVFPARTRVTRPGIQSAGPLGARPQLARAKT